MVTAKDFGKTARGNKINAPTLDDNFLSWLKGVNAENNRIFHFAQWWEGWYAAIDDSLYPKSQPITKSRSPYSR